MKILFYFSVNKQKIKKRLLRKITLYLVTQEFIEIFSFQSLQVSDNLELNLNKPNFKHNQCIKKVLEILL